MKNKALFSLLGLFFFTAMWTNAQVANVKPGSVPEAYSLRMAGKADQADQLLTDLLKKDSLSAQAWFEMARLRHHKFLGSRDLSQAAWANVVIAFAKAARLESQNDVFAFYYAYGRLFDAFISMMTGQQDAGAKTKQACEAFQEVLKLNPKCSAARLYLVDVYAMLPPDMGGDRELAKKTADELNAYDKVCGAVANSRLMPDTTDFVKYWQQIAAETGMVARIMEEIGRAYLLKSDSEQGSRYYLDAIKADDTEKWLIWNLVRYHIMITEQDPTHKTEHLQAATTLVNNFLKDNPDIYNPVKAYANGTLGLIRQVEGNNEGSKEFLAKAAALDPYYSGATGAPSEMLFFPPDKVKIIYSSFFLPF